MSGQKSEQACCGIFLIQAALMMVSDREERDWNGLRETGVRRGTGTLVDPQTGELTRGYMGLNKGTGI